MSRPKQPFPDAVERFQKHMPKGRDLTLLVLKAHLLVEAELNEVLELILRNPDALYRARFTFIQRLRVLEATSPDPNISHLAFAISALNELRNTLAHQLEPSEVERKAALFTDAAFYAGTLPSTRGVRRPPTSFTKADFSLTAFKQAIAYAIGMMAGQKRFAEGQNS